MSSSQLAQVSAAPVKVAPPIATKHPRLAFCAVCQLPELDEIAHVVAEITSVSTATIRP